ncbi:MAG TPA: hypothetical protein VFR47_01790 [Anaerolineales bacterium]|nr:hypothetical protein [Anaerolineales bacterium]
MIDTQHIAHAKRAELLSSFGAGVLGAGIGLLLANSLAGFAFPILLLGLISHSVGMFQKHQLEQGRYVRIWWAESLYWLCWLALAVLLVYIVIRQF